MATLADLWLARHLRDEFGKISAFVPLLSFWFFVVVLYSGLDFRLTYVILAVIGLVLIHHSATVELARGHRQKARQYVDIPNFTIRKAIGPGVLGAALVFAFFFGYLLLSGQGVNAQNPLQQSTDFTTQVFLVAPVETFFFQWVLAQNYGGIPPAILFGISHPAVRDLLLTNPGGVALPFLYYFLFALIFQQLVFMGSASNVSPRLRALTGVPFVIGLHGAYNTVAFLFPGTVVLGQEITPFMVLPGVLVVGVLVAVLYAIRNIRGLSMRRAADPSRFRICAQLHLIPRGIVNPGE